MKVLNTLEKEVKLEDKASKASFNLSASLQVDNRMG